MRGTQKEVLGILKNYSGKLSYPSKTISILEELYDLAIIDKAIEELGITVLVPKNTLGPFGTATRLDNIYIQLRNAKPPKIFDPNKAALRNSGIKLPKSQKGLSVDFAGTPYLYPVQAGERNIVKIKLTGSDYYDFKLANYIADIKIKPENYTWHHLDDFDPNTGTCTMQLVETKIHEKTNPHYGGVEIVKKYFNTTTLYKSRNKIKKIKL